MTGVIQGGWEFVIAAYTITGIALVVYGISLIVRLKELNKHD
ncbi:MAG TPA: CcmD family protein [Thermoanaerobaculia bacterium]|nr:CcmD family protein [Thermoanaerobaculia bacterium]